MGKNFLGLDGLKHFWSKAKTWIINRITTEVTAKIAEIVANAPEDLDTLKEISDWISTHEDSASAMNTAILAKANRYGNSYNCVQCSYIARKVDLECLISEEQRYVYIGKPSGFSTGTNVGCAANFWFCPGCNVLTIDGSSGSCGSAICLTGEGSCLMNGVCSRKNPSIVFATTDNQCACLQYSQYDAVHTGAGLCLASNTTNTWFDTDCVFANKFINRNGCQIGGYCATLPSPSGNTKYALLDFGAVEASVYFSVYDNEGTIVKANTNTPYGKVYAQNTYGITGFCSLGKESATNACFWLRYNGWRNVNLWGKYPIKVVSNTTTNPGCTWQGPTIPPSCDYVSTVAGQCKSAACTYANTVAGQCKGVDCTYANCVGTECKKDACTYANTVSFCNINVCRGLSIIGTSTYCDSKCWGTDGNWTYLTFTEAPDNHWHYVIKMDGYDACRRAGFAFPADDFQQNGVYYKLGLCGGNDGWKLIPDITCVQKVALSCGNASETLACTYANTVAGQCKSAACTYANTVAGQCKSAACTYAHCTVNACKGIGVMGVARDTNVICWTEPGYWAYMTSLDGPTDGWNHVIKMDWNDRPGITDPWRTGISIPTYSSHNAGIHYKYGCCAGHIGWTLVPNITCVQTLSGSCASSIGTACKNAACAFAAACAQKTTPETSTFAKCYGNSTSCVECANKIRLNAFSSNVYYKIPFTSTTGAASTSGCLVVDAYPSYNPVSQVSCVYTECVAKTLAVPNGNGCLRLGSYCIYIG